MAGSVNSQCLQPTRPVCQQSWLKGLLSRRTRRFFPGGNSLVLITPTHGRTVRLSWRGWLVRPRKISVTVSWTTTRSPIQVLTGPSVKQLRWCDRRCYQEMNAWRLYISTSLEDLSLPVKHRLQTIELYLGLMSLSSFICIWSLLLPSPDFFSMYSLVFLFLCVHYMSTLTPVW